MALPRIHDYSMSINITRDDTVSRILRKMASGQVLSSKSETQLMHNAIEFKKLCDIVIEEVGDDEQTVVYGTITLMNEAAPKVYHVMVLSNHTVGHFGNSVGDVEPIEGYFHC